MWGLSLPHPNIAAREPQGDCELQVRGCHQPCRVTPASPGQAAVMRGLIPSDSSLGVVWWKYQLGLLLGEVVT